MQYFVAIRMGTNAEGFPVDWIDEPIRIRARAGRDEGAFEHAVRPSLPAEYASNPLASVMSTDELREHQRPLSAAFNAARTAQSAPLFTKRERIRRLVDRWKEQKRERGFRHAGVRISLSSEMIATLAVLTSARTSLTYPLNAFGLQFADAPSLRAFEVTAALRLAEIEERAAVFATRIASADIATLKDIAAELEL
jgi:hypothetical protein